MDEKGGFCGLPLQLLRRPGLVELWYDIIGASAFKFLESDNMVEMNSKKGSAVVMEPHTRQDCEARARKVLGFNNGSFDAWVEAFSCVRQWLNSCASDEPALWVRVPTSMVFELSSGEMSPRDFRAHVALLSVVGVRQYARVSGDVIASRSAGYLRKVPASAVVRPLSRWQIDAALDVLRARDLWSVVNYRRQGKRGGGERWFSNRLSPEPLVDQVMARKTKRRLDVAVAEEAQAWAKHRKTPQDPRKSPATGAQPLPQVPPHVSPQIPPHV